VTRDGGPATARRFLFARRHRELLNSWGVQVRRGGGRGGVDPGAALIPLFARSERRYFAYVLPKLSRVGRVSLLHALKPAGELAMVAALT
jgi:hypothetical protein